MQLLTEKVFFEKTHFLNLAKSKSKRIKANQSLWFSNDVFSHGVIIKPLVL